MEEAVKTWNQLVEGERAIAQNYDRLAQLLHAKDFQMEAVAASRKATELAPTEYRYRENISQTTGRNQEFLMKQSPSLLKRRSMPPNDFFAEQMAAQQIEVYRLQGVLDDRIAELEAQPQSFNGQKLLAKMYLKLRNTTAAAAALEKALGLNPDDISVNRSLAEIYAQLRQHDKAKAAYARLVTLDSTNAREYHANLVRLHLGPDGFLMLLTQPPSRFLAHSPTQSRRTSNSR